MLLKKAVLFGAFLVFLLNTASAQYYYDQSYSYFSPFNFGGIGDILYFYESNAGWIDFFIFLVLFLGLTQAVFSEGHFKSQSKTISIGLSLALSFALVIWERNTGINLLSFGPVALLILFLLIIYVIFSLLKKMGNEWWVSGAWAYVIGYIFLMFFGSQLFNIIPNENLFWWMNFFFWISLLIGLGGLLFEHHPKKPAWLGGHP